MLPENIFSANEIEVTGINDIELMWKRLMNIEIQKQLIGNDFISVVGTDRVTGDTRVMGVATRDYQVYDFADMYEVDDYLRNAGWTPVWMYIWRWRKIYVKYVNPDIKRIPLQWKDAYGVHEDRYTADIYLINSFDRATGLIIAPEVIRLVCSNGLMAKSLDYSISIRHIGSKKLELLKSMVDTAIQRVLQTLEKYALVWIDNRAFKIIEKELGKRTFEKVVKSIGRSDNPAMYRDEFGRLNFYDLVQGITYYYSHEDVNINTYSQVFARINRIYNKLKEEGLLIEVTH